MTDGTADGTTERKGISVKTYRKGRAVKPVRTGLTAQRVLLAQGVVVGAATLALLVHELPGMVREVRIWRMINVRSGGKRPR